jgi:S1-C subfamily serine protease
VTGIEQLATYIDQHNKPGDKINLDVIRDGNSMTITATLAPWPSA